MHHVMIGLTNLTQQAAMLGCGHFDGGVVVVAMG
jgi:hypothetical protein